MVWTNRQDFLDHLITTEGLHAPPKPKAFALHILDELRDTERHVHFYVVHRANIWCHACCRVVVAADGDIRLAAGFSMAILEYAMPEDLPLQEEVNAHLSQGLARWQQSNCPAGPDLPQLFQDAWVRSEARIWAQWHENEAADCSAQQLSLLYPTRQTGDKPYGALAIGCVSTRLGATHLFGVRSHRKGTYGAIERFSDNRYQLRNVSPGLLKRVALYPSEKERLSPWQQPAEYRQARRDFDSRRFWGVKMELAWPMPMDRVVAFHEIATTYSAETVQLFFDSGDRVWMTLSADGGPGPEFQLAIFRGRRDLPKIELLLDRKTRKLRIGSMYAKGLAHKSVEDLHDMLRFACRVILMADPSYADSLLEALPEGFDPDHPVLAGIDVPPRHQKLIGAFLGKPYVAALARTEKRAAKLEAARLAKRKPPL